MKDDIFYKGYYIQYAPHPKLLGKYEVFKTDKKETFIGRYGTVKEAKRAVNTLLK